MGNARDYYIIAGGSLGKILGPYLSWSMAAEELQRYGYKPTDSSRRWTREEFDKTTSAAFIMQLKDVLARLEIDERLRRSAPLRER